jgi:predicted DNA-binding protein (UPF0251 family)
MPQVTYYKPRGIPLVELQCVELTVDEFEAIRLADCERLYHEQAAERMNVSRQTFGRILDAARAKVADALVHGKALSIEGGPVEIAAQSVASEPPCRNADASPSGKHRCCRRDREEPR